MEPLSDAAPCGENLEYDPAFLELVHAARGTEQVEVGDTVLEAEPPDWRDVDRRARALMERTRDVRVVTLLAMAQLNQQGVPGFRSAIELLVDLLDAFWDTIHPQLDPDDGNDPTMRLNAIEGLRHESGFLRALREAPIANDGPAERYLFRDLLAAQRLFEPSEAVAKQIPSPEDVEKAMMSTGYAALQESAEAIAGSLEAVQRLDQLLMERAGANHALDWSPLQKQLEDMRKVLNSHLARRGDQPATDPEATSAADPGSGSSADAGNSVEPSASSRGAVGALGPLASREDVARAMDMICDYYRRHEPGSPIPLLVMRARRLVSKSFLEIMEDLAPEGVPQVRQIGGLASENGESEERSA